MSSRGPPNAIWPPNRAPPGLTLLTPPVIFFPPPAPMALIPIAPVVSAPPPPPAQTTALVVKSKSKPKTDIPAKPASTTSSKASTVSTRSSIVSTASTSSSRTASSKASSTASDSTVRPRMRATATARVGSMVARATVAVGSPSTVSSSSSRSSPNPATSVVKVITTKSLAASAKTLPSRHLTTFKVIFSVKVWRRSALRKLNGVLPTKLFKVPTGTSVAELMEQLVEEFGAAVRLVEEETDDGKGDQEQWCLTEVLEKGDGEFNKDKQIKQDSPLAAKRLDDLGIGWDQRRGISRSTVWVVLHRI